MKINEKQILAVMNGIKESPAALAVFKYFVQVEVRAELAAMGFKLKEIKTDGPESTTGNISE